MITLYHIPSRTSGQDVVTKQDTLARMLSPSRTSGQDVVTKQDIWPGCCHQAGHLARMLSPSGTSGQDVVTKWDIWPGCLLCVHQVGHLARMLAVCPPVAHASHLVQPGFSASCPSSSLVGQRLSGLVVKQSSREREIQGSATGFSGRHTSDLKVGTLLATLADAWCYRASLGLVGQASVDSGLLR